jgi:hypothetical protein
MILPKIIIIITNNSNPIVGLNKMLAPQQHSEAIRKY